MNIRLRILSILFVVLSVGTALPVQHALGLSGSDFQAGRIVDDGMFYNGGNLSPSQIQSFLNSKVPTCDTNHARSSSGNDSGAPYTCLKDYRQTTWSIPADAYCNGFSGGSKSAAEIIYEVGVSCGINSKVILVTLQKEQSFVTDTWPWSIQYEKATGFGCPDNPPANWPNGCDPDYSGFFRQVYYGARQFKRYAQDTNIFTQYRPYRTNTINYNPNSGCGGSNVYIQNQATSSLYIYTPYQPNAAALSNLYGTGDGCSAYGNRNFWRLFNDWFGTTYSNQYYASYVSQSPYPSLFPGETSTVTFAYQNRGNSFWKDDLTSFPGAPSVRIATAGPINRSSNFYDSSWISGNRPTGTISAIYNSDGSTLAGDQHTVYPGQIAYYSFKIRVPSSLPAGTYREQFQLVAEGSAEWDVGGLTYQDITVKPWTSAGYVSQSSYPTIKRGESKQAFFNYRNTGNTAWKDDVSVGAGEYPVHLATSQALNRVSPFYDDSWTSINRPSGQFSAVYENDGTTLASNQHVVQPGQIARFTTTFTAGTDAAAGTYREYFQPLLEGSSNYAMGGLVFQDVTITATNLQATYSSQSSYPTLSRGGTATVFVVFRNSGSASWRDNQSKTGFIAPLHLATSDPINRNSMFTDSGWGNASRPALLLNAVYETDGVTLASNQHVVQPGQYGRYSFTVRAPSTVANGTYKESFQLVAEGASNWQLGSGSVFWQQITVR